MLTLAGVLGYITAVLLTTVDCGHSGLGPDIKAACALDS